MIICRCILETSAKKSLISASEEIELGRKSRKATGEEARSQDQNWYRQI